MRRSLAFLIGIAICVVLGIYLAHRTPPQSAPQRTVESQNAAVAAALAAQSSNTVAGTLEGFTREGAEEAILTRGGKSPGSVSKRTFVVVLGADPGAAKLRKAEEVGTPVLDEAAFIVLLETGEIPTG